MRRTFALLCAALVAGCASTPPSAPATEGLLHDTAFSTPAAVSSAAEVFALNPAMKGYLRTAAASVLRQHGLQQGLVEALYSQKHLKLDYDAERTRTAAEAFDARAGNCLSLVIMTAAFAKELGLRVRYQVVESADIWDRSGDLVFNIGHVNLALGQPAIQDRFSDIWPSWLTVDFMAAPGDARARTWPIAEERVLAMYLNNRAAENLALGRTEEAYWWARAAVLQDPLFADAYNTLGVVYRRHADPAWAEDAFRVTLALQPDNRHALGNLASVVRAQGREAEAAELSARLQRLQPHPPFEYLALGQQALREGRYAQARDLFKKELPFASGHHEVHFGLALAYYRLGDTESAARHLKLAREMSMTRQQQALYSAKLASLKAAGAVQ